MCLNRRRYFSTGRITCFLIVLGLSACGSSACQATMLNLTPQGSPADITSAYASATYSTVTKLLSIAGTAAAIDYDQTAPPDALVDPGGVGKPASFLISVHVDSLGALLGPATA